MKLVLTHALLFVLITGCRTAHPPAPPVPKTTFSSFDQPVKGVVAQTYGPGEINFMRVTFDQFVRVYQETANRTVIQAPELSKTGVTLRNQNSITRVEALQLFDTALSLNGIAMIFDGEKTIKAVPLAVAAQEPGPVIDLPADQLPDCGSYMVRIVHLKRSKPSELVPTLQPFAKVPNGIVPMDGQRVIVLRDFSANIKQMLKLIDLAEGSGKRGAN